MYEFDYRRPDSVSAAVAALKKDDEARLIAGGMTLLPTLKLRLAQPSALIDLGAIAGLSGIERKGDTLRVGAMTTHSDVARSQEVREAIPALADLASLIGDAQVRNRGTMGGSVANNDPAADYPAALLGLGATISTDRREIAADDFFKDMFETALDEKEIVTGVSFPIPERAGYAKFPNPASRYAIVGVMVARREGAVRVAVTGAGASVFRVPEFETALAASFSAAALDGVSYASQDLNEDLHATAEYRHHLIGVMARRAMQSAGG